jgi:uncharacterized protein (DUF1778 family)
MKSRERGSARSTGAGRKGSRLEVRLTEAQKRLLQRAADVRDESLTEFVTRVSETAARKELEKSGVLVLSREDQEILVKALLDPPPPNSELSRAMRRYRRVVGMPRDR